MAPIQATKSIRQQLSYRPGISDWFASTQDLYNRVVGHYFAVI